MAAIKIKWDFGYSVDGSARVGFAKPELEVDSYGVTKVKVDAGASMDVAVSPVDIMFLAITADVYSDKVSYKVDGGANSFVLDAPHVFIGKGAAMFTGSSAPGELTFANTAGAGGPAVNVQVVVGRKA